MKILEREPYLETLRDCLAQASAGRGRLVFLAGEAGVGKSTLIERFADIARPASPMAVVSCDGLKMPGPFGPLFDIAEALGPEVQALLEEQAPRDRIFRSVLTALKGAQAGNVLVGEDAHWTDEASLELIRFLGRRIGATHTLLIVTYRDDALDAYHPLRRVLGDLINEPAVIRIHLPPLSLEAVTELAADSGLDPVALHDQTGGNPFYVSEIVDAGSTEIPESIRDAVLGRASGVSSEGRALLDAAAVIGVSFDPDLLAAVIGAPIADAVDECLGKGLFRETGENITFRHGLARSVILGSMSSPRRRDLHRRILHILEEDPSFSTDLAHLAHHAEEARDVDATVRYARAAAEYSRSYGAHREAAAQYGRLLRFAHALPSRELAELLEARSYECYLTGQPEEAIADRTRAVEMWQAEGDLLKAGDNLRWLSRLTWFAGRNAEAETHAQAALQLLETLPPGPELAMACSNIAQIRMLSYAHAAAIEWGERAIALAMSLGNQPILAHALTTVGTARLMALDHGGRDILETAIRIGLEHDLGDDVARAHTNLAWTSLDHRELDAAERDLANGLAFTSERDLLAMELYLRAGRARAALGRGRWDQAADEARTVSELPSAISLTRIVALTVLGQVRARQGHDPAPCLDEALALAERTGELMRLGPLRAARAEAAFLAGDSALAVAEAEAEYGRAIAAGDRWLAGELALWLHRGGRPVQDVSCLAEPFALEIAGDGIAAAAFWEARGYPLEQARALASTGQDFCLLEALAIVDRLGGQPDAARIIRALREAGVTAIPRRPRPATRANVAQLTARELDVLRLLIEGKPNREIAATLFLSPRTVGHHVSAILGKLEISSRAEASTRVRELDLFADRSSLTSI